MEPTLTPLNDFPRLSAGYRKIFRVAVLTLGLLSAGLPFAAWADGLLLVCNKGDRTLSIIDPVTGLTLTNVLENGVTGHEVAASPDGRLAFVPIYGNSGVGHAGTDGSLIRVIDLKQRAIVGTIEFGKGVRPHCAVFGPKDKLLYVTTELEQAVTVIDPQSLKIIGSIPTGQPESHMLAISSDGQRGYTANVGPGTVSVLDLEARKLVQVIPVSKSVQRICLTPDDRWVFTADQAQPRLAMIDTRSNEIAQWIPLPGLAYGTVVTPNGRWLLAALDTINKVAIVDLQTRQVARLLDMPGRPQEIIIQPGGDTAYVSCDNTKRVAVIDMATSQVKTVFAAGRSADGLAWAAEE